MMARRAELESEAKHRAESIVKAAEERARQILAEDSITQQARQKANEMVQQAEERSRELKRSANEYCEDAPAPHRGGGGRGLRRDQEVPGPVPGRRRRVRRADRPGGQPPHVRRGR